MISFRFFRVVAVLSGVLSLAGLGSHANPADALVVNPRYEVKRTLFLKTPVDGQTPIAATYYTRNRGLDLLSVHMMLSRADTFENVVYRYSADNGRTWSADREIWRVDRKSSTTVRRRLEKVSYLDPLTDRFITLRTEAPLLNDDPLQGVNQWAIYYTVSEDGGRSWLVDEPVVHVGAEYSPEHPLPGVHRGRNCAMIGDYTAVPLALADGTIVVPMQVFPAGEDGAYENKGGGYTFSYSGVLRGRWRADKRIDWELSTLVKLDTARSTRGTIEPTLAQLPDGRILMVMRASNDKRAAAELIRRGLENVEKPAMFGGRWMAWSTDGGKTWTEDAQPWTYTNGERFYSPSSCSQLLTHSSGRIFWIGNMSRENPVGNLPRYPMVIAEVDRQTGLVLKETVGIVDDRAPGESENLLLSNFYAREDRETGAIIINMSRQGLKTTRERRDFTGDAYLYTITLR